MKEPHHTDAYLAWENKKQSPDKILEAIQSIKEPKYKALAAFLYVTGCRISEAIPYTGKQEWHDKKGIRKNQVIIDTTNPKKVKITGVRNLKRRLYRSRKEYYKDDNGFQHYRLIKDTERTNKKADLYREIGFSVGKAEQPFWNIFLEYYNTIKPIEELFPFKYVDCYYKICARQWKTKKGLTKKEGGNINPHAIRHQRFTHFVDHYRLHPQQLRRKAGWASSHTADQYVESSSEDMIEQEARVQQQEDKK
jgi:integrase